MAINIIPDRTNYNVGIAPLSYVHSIFAYGAAYGRLIYSYIHCIYSYANWSRAVVIGSQ